MTSIDRYWRWLITGVAENCNPHGFLSEMMRLAAHLPSMPFPEPLLSKCSMSVQTLLLITLIQPKPHDHPQARRLPGWIKPKATVSWIYGQN